MEQSLYVFPDRTYGVHVQYIYSARTKSIHVDNLINNFIITLNLVLTCLQQTKINTTCNSCLCTCTCTHTNDYLLRIFMVFIDTIIKNQEKYI